MITAIVLFRYFLHLQPHIPVADVRKLAKLLLVFGVVYAYFVINEHAGTAYTSEGSESPLLNKMITGRYALQFWGMVFVGLVIPIVMLATPLGRGIAGITIASVLVNMGMWLSATSSWFPRWRRPSCLRLKGPLSPMCQPGWSGPSPPVDSRHLCCCSSSFRRSFR